MRNHYDTLGIINRNSQTEIQGAYELHKSMWDPARVEANDQEKQQRVANQVRQIDDAYETLSDPDKRAAYDRELSHSQRRFGWPGCSCTGCLIPLLLVAALLLIPAYLYTTRNTLVQGQLTSLTSAGTHDGAATVQARFSNNTWIPKHAYVDATLQLENGRDCWGRSGIFESPATVVIPATYTITDSVMALWNQWFGDAETSDSRGVSEYELRIRCWNGEPIPANMSLQLAECQLYVGNSRTIAYHKSSWHKSALACQ